MIDTRSDRASRPVIVWFRQDLRLSDNPALSAAAQTGRPVIAVYVLDDQSPGQWGIGGASRWWLHHSLTGLARSLRERGVTLVLRRGSGAGTIIDIVNETDAAEVLWNRCYEPFAVTRDSALKTTLTEAGVSARSFNSALLFEPWEVKTGAGRPYRVFSPFWRACLNAGVPMEVIPPPDTLKPGPPLASDTLVSWGLQPTAPDWSGELAEAWTPGEVGARARLDAFLAGPIETYKNDRDFLNKPATSGLSPHLHWGEISPRAIARALSSVPGTGAEKFLSELGWREFSHHLLYDAPTLPHENLRSNFDAFPWRADDDALEAWKRGRTGYPVVDAAMRELWATGWMHNRARMIVGSFLVKHLLIDWREGEAWFWDTLVDADLANNAASWQWIAGCGADAAPYFRIFNPMTQGQKFDAEGGYVRRWVPELAALPADAIHAPWEAEEGVLRAAGVVLGETYPHPIVDHRAARERALEAYEHVKAPA